MSIQPQWPWFRCLCPRCGQLVPALRKSEPDGTVWPVAHNDVTTGRRCRGNLRVAS